MARENYSAITDDVVEHTALKHIRFEDQYFKITWPLEHKPREYGTYILSEVQMTTMTVQPVERTKTKRIWSIYFQKFR